MPAAANNPTAGLQKWVFDSATGQWNLAYTLTDGPEPGPAVHGAGLSDGR